MWRKKLKGNSVGIKKGGKSPLSRVRDEIGRM